MTRTMPLCRCGVAAVKDGEKESASPVTAERRGCPAPDSTLPTHSHNECSDL
jgi:hypothetical protein